jgi:hypothetical protein
MMPRYFSKRRQHNFQTLPASDALARLRIRLLLSSFAIIAADEAIIWFEFLIGSSGRPS